MLLYIMIESVADLIFEFILTVNAFVFGYISHKWIHRYVFKSFSAWWLDIFWFISGSLSSHAKMLFLNMIRVYFSISLHLPTPYAFMYSNSSLFQLCHMNLDIMLTPILSSAITLLLKGILTKVTMIIPQITKITF